MAFLFTQDFDPTFKIFLTEDKVLNGNFVRAGTPAFRLEIAHAKGKQYTFNSFRIYQMYLNIAENLQKEAENMIREIKLVKAGKRHQLKGKNGDDKIVWKFFGAIFTAIIFSYTSIEAYVNQVIEPHVDTLIEKCTEQVYKPNKEGIFLPIDIIRGSLKFKIFSILPLCTKLDKRKLQNISGNLTTLEELRNTLIHLKESEIRTGIDRQSIIWNHTIPRFDNGRLKLYPFKIADDIINNIENNLR